MEEKLKNKIKFLHQKYKDLPHWFHVALDEYGTKEIAGSLHNPDIVKYHACTKNLDPKLWTDETPWCASGASWTLQKAGLDSPLTCRAADFLKCGKGLLDPIPGCLAIKSRKGGAHVTFFVKWLDEHRFVGYGFNQGQVRSNKVCFSIFDLRKTKILGYRWPVVGEENT